MSSENRVFLDTNILLPNAVWNLSSNHLNKYKSSKNGQVPFLSSNHLIPVEAVEEANSGIDSINNYCDSLSCGYAITGGVYTQTNGVIQDICKNIDMRANGYFYSLFGNNIPPKHRSDSRVLYDKLTDLKQSLSSLEERISTNLYTPEYSQLHSFTDSFVRAINTYFFNLGKDNHKFDDNTDEELVVCSLYESLKSGLPIEVVSSDVDVHEIMSASVEVLKTYTPLLKSSKIFQSFLENPPIVKYDKDKNLNYVQRPLLSFEAILEKISPGNNGSNRAPELSRYLDRQLSVFKSALESL